MIGRRGSSPRFGQIFLFMSFQEICKKVSLDCKFWYAAMSDIDFTINIPDKSSKTRKLSRIIHLRTDEI